MEYDGLVSEPREGGRMKKSFNLKGGMAVGMKLYV